MSDVSYPPIKVGTSVRTTEDKSSGGSWTKAALAKRRWGVKGVTIAHHDSHGLYYEVKHEDDGTVGCYDPTELQVL